MGKHQEERELSTFGTSDTERLVRFNVTKQRIAVTMTAGASLSRKGRDVTVAKTLLLENLAVGLETGALTIAHDLPGKQDLLNEVASFELASTSAGNLVLQGGGKGHHADRAISLALAYLSVTHLDSGSMPVQQKLVGWR